jgi:hypothetical protein
MPSVDQTAKWPRLSAEKTRSVFERLSLIVRCGRSLPNGYSVDSLFLNESGYDVLNCAELILAGNPGDPWDLKPLLAKCQ